MCVPVVERRFQIQDSNILQNENLPEKIWRIVTVHCSTTLLLNVFHIIVLGIPRPVALFWSMLLTNNAFLHCFLSRKFLCCYDRTLTSCSILRLWDSTYNFSDQIFFMIFTKIVLCKNVVSPYPPPPLPYRLILKESTACVWLP